MLHEFNYQVQHSAFAQWPNCLVKGTPVLPIASAKPNGRPLPRALGFMKTRDLRNDQGQLIGFCVSNLLLSRHVVPKVVKSIQGAQVGRKQKRFAPSAQDDFCEFIVDGKTFLAIEPFGDNSEYWIVTEPPEECVQVEKVRHAFSMHRVLGLIYPG